MPRPRRRLWVGEVPAVRLRRGELDAAATVATVAQGGRHWTVAVCWSPCPFGGWRAWLVCSWCSRRCAALFLDGDRLRCRRCSDLAYPSQSLARRERHRRRYGVVVQRIQRRLDAGAEVDVDGWPTLPPRPRWMRRRRYAELVAAAEAAAAAFDEVEV